MPGPWEQYQDMPEQLPAQTPIDPVGKPWLAYKAPVSAIQKIEDEKDDEPGFFATVSEAITGEKRTTPEIKDLPEFGDMKAANALSIPAFRSSLGMLMSFSPEDQIGIIKENFPESEIETNKDGVTFITIDGERGVLNKPGFSAQDMAASVAQALSFTPAAKMASFGRNIAAKIGIGAAAAATTQAGIEGIQTLLGGEYDPEDIALAGIFGAGAEAAVPLVRNTWNVAKDVTLKGTEAAKQATKKISSIGKDKAKSLQQAVELNDLGIDIDIWKTLDKDEKIKLLNESREAARFGVTREEFFNLSDEAKTAISAERALLEKQTADREMINEVVEATRLSEKPGQATEAAERLAEIAEVDPQAQAAAKRLNVANEMLASQMTKNPVFRELSMAIQSSPGSQLSAQSARAMDAYSQAGREMILRLGGDLDRGSVSAALQENMTRTIRGMEKETGNLYRNLKDTIGDDMPIQATALVRYLKNKVKVMGGEQYLPSTEKALLKAFRPSAKPTYARLDAFRKRIGAGYKGKDEVFQSADRAELDKWYSLLTRAQESAALKNNVLPLFKVAKDSVKVRKAIEDDIRALFGNKLQKTLSRTVGPAIKNLKSGQIKEFVNIARSIPADQRKQVVASAVGEVVDVPLNQFMTWYKGLNQNKSAREALLRFLPSEFKQGLRDLYTVGQGIQQASKKAIATGRIQDVNQAFEAADAVTEGIFREALRAGVGFFGTAQLGFWSGKITDALLDRALQRQQTPIRKAVDNLMMDSRFQVFLQKAATNENIEFLDKAAKSLEKTAAWKRYLRYLSASSRNYINNFGITDFLVRRPLRFAKEITPTAGEAAFLAGQAAAQRVGEE